MKDYVTVELNTYTENRSENILGCFDAMGSD